MGKINGEYKYKYIAIPVITSDICTDTHQINFLKNAITKLIAEYIKDIENESKSDSNSSINRDRVKSYAETIAILMAWKTNIKVLGTDTYIGELDFYKNGIEKT